MSQRRTVSALVLMFAFVSTFTIGNAQQQRPRGNTLDDIAIIVDTEIITRREWNQAWSQAQAQVRHLPGTARPSAKEMETEVVNSLAITKLQQKIAKMAGVMIADAEVDAALLEIAQRNNATVAQLQDFLKQQGMSYERFREDIRGQITSVRLRDQILKSVRVTNDEVDVYMKSAEFNEIKHQIEKSNTPQINVSHILIRISNDRTETEAKSQIERLRDRIQGGETFETIASAQSQDPGSAAKEGNLGWVTLGQLAPEFEKAMLALQPGELSQPVRTPFGYHLIKVAERKSGIANDEMLKMVAKDYYYRKKAAQAYSIWQEKMLADAYIERRF